LVIICVDRFDKFLGYVDFPAALGARMPVAASSS